MKYLALLFCLVSAPFTFGADNAQLVQTNVNVQQNNVEANSNSNNNSPDKIPIDQESATSSIGVQQDVISVNQEGPQPQPQQPNLQQSPPPPPPPPQPQQTISDAQNVQLLKEANAQYQYQINSRYEEKTRPIYGGSAAAAAVAASNNNNNNNNNNYNPNEPINSQYVGQSYPYGPLPGFPYYKENNQYQELGNGQRRTETNVAINDGVKSQFENQDQSTYTHQRSQSYSEYGKGESSPDYNTYTYKRTYY